MSFYTWGAPHEVRYMAGVMRRRVTAPLVTQTTNYLGLIFPVQKFKDGDYFNFSVPHPETSLLLTLREGRPIRAKPSSPFSH